MRDENQLHAAIVEIIVKDNAEVKYSTVQNWYPGDEHGKGGVLNLVTKRGDLRGVNSKLSWTQVETGSAITWKYPSCILRGDNSVAEFYSVAVTNNYQEADTGTKMIHMVRTPRVPSSLRVSRQVIARTPIEVWFVLHPMPTMPATTVPATPCCWVAIVERIPSHIWMPITTQPCSSMRQPPRRFQKTSSSIAISEAFLLRRQSV